MKEENKKEEIKCCDKCYTTYTEKDYPAHITYDACLNPSCICHQKCDNECHCEVCCNGGICYEESVRQKEAQKIKSEENKKEPIDLGQQCECGICGKRYCICLERQSDGNWKSQKPPAKIEKNWEEKMDELVVNYIDEVFPSKEGEAHTWLIPLMVDLKCMTEKLLSACFNCKKKRKLEYAEEHKEKIKAYQREYRLSANKNKMEEEKDEVSDRYPDMKLWQEIVFLKKWFKGKYVVENVISYYPPLWPPRLLDRHYFWANFGISDFKINAQKPNNICNARKSTRRPSKDDLEALEDYHGFKIDKKNKNRRILLRNCVYPELGLHIFQEAFREHPKLF